MELNYKYYNTYTNSTIIPKLYFNLKLNKNDLFIFEWVEFVSYFKKVVTVLDFYIMKSLIKNYYSDENINSSRILISKIIKNLNYYIYNEIHFEYFVTFESSIKRFNRLKEIIVSNCDFSAEKRKNFIHFIVSTIDLLQEIIIIFEDYNIFYKLNEHDYDYFGDFKNKNLEFIPFAGNLNLKSFWISKDCVSIYQYLKFIEDNGYDSTKYWSKEGFHWAKYHNIKMPKNWKKIDNKWYISNEPIEFYYNYPVSKISFYEAEACAKYYKCRIPTEEEWNWVSTNRNKTSLPFGIDLPIICNLPTEFSGIKASDNSSSISLMGVDQLYGNIWEYTSDIKIKDYKIFIYAKGGDWKIPNFILNNDLKMLLQKDSRNYSVGFRFIKD